MSALIQRLLGGQFDALPPVLREAHAAATEQRWAGTATVTSAESLLARALCRVLGLPKQGYDVPVAVVFTPGGTRERWHRTFDGRSYCSEFDAEAGLLVERMGPVTNLFRLSVTSGLLRFDLVGFRVLGVRVPEWLRPICHASEREEAGRYVFDVPVHLPGLGFVIHYTGSMERIDG